MKWFRKPKAEPKKDTESTGEVTIRGDSKMIEYVIALLQTPTDEDKKRVVDHHPSVLSAEGLDILKQIEEIHRSRNDIAAANAVNGLYLIVETAMQHGMDFAMMQQVVLKAFLDTPDDVAEHDAYLSTVDQRFPELLRPLADKVLAEQIDREHSDILQAFFTKLRVAVAAARERLLPPNRPKVAANVGAVVWTAEQLLESYQANGDLTKIERAIDGFKTAVALDAPAAVCLDGIGRAHKLHYLASGEIGRIQDAVAVHDRVANIGPSNDPDYPLYMDHFALALRWLYSETKELRHLERAIEIQERFAAQMPNDRDRSIAKENLGSSYFLRYEETDELPDLTKAISLFDEVLAGGAADDQTRLGVRSNQLRAFMALFRATGDRAQFAKARTLFSELKADPLLSPINAFHLGFDWAWDMFGHEEWAEVIEGYRAAVDAVRDLVFFAERDDAAKQNWLLRFQWVVGDAGYAHAQLGQCEQAVAAIESGLSLLLYERLQRSGRSLSALGDTEYGGRVREFELAVGMIRSAAQDPEIGNRYEIQRRYRAAVDGVRQIPGFEGFFGDPRLENVTAGLRAADGALYIVSSRHGGVSLLVRGTSVVPLWHPRLTQQALQEALYGTGYPTKSTGGMIAMDLNDTNGYLAALFNWRRDITMGIADDDVRTEWERALSTTSQWLWNAAASDIAKRLTEDGLTTVVLVLVGSLGALPFHAAANLEAAPSDESDVPTLSDFCAVTYAPSISSLSQTGVSAPTIPNSIIAVGNPESLAFAEAEIGIISAGFPKAECISDSMAADAVIDALTTADVWHFACHSEVDRTAGGSGSLILPGNGRLSLASDAFKASRPPRLVVLSACETGAPSLKVHTESISIATDFIALGANAIVATAWPVDDLWCCLFMAHMYDGLSACGWDVPHALQGTQRWFRTSTPTEKLEFLRKIGARSIVVADAIANISAILEEMAGSGRQHARHDWAGFVAVGLPRSVG